MSTLKKKKKKTHIYLWYIISPDQTVFEQFTEANDFRQKKSQPSNRIFPTWPSENLAHSLPIKLIFLMLKIKILSQNIC